jgi:hypothetical protein
VTTQRLLKHLECKTHQKLHCPLNIRNLLTHDGESPDIRTFCLIERKTLEDCFTVLHLTHTQKSPVKRGVLPQCSTIPVLPCTHDGAKRFVEEGCIVASSSPRKSAHARSADLIVECGVKDCQQVFKVQDSRHHAACHLGHDKGPSSKVGHPIDSICGLCACCPAAPCSADDGLLACPVWLVKPPRGQSWKPKSKCRIFDDVSCSLNAAKKSTKDSPSTNAPIQCPECPKDPMPRFFWKHGGMNAHWDQHHKDTAMPDELKKELEITDQEDRWCDVMTIFRLWFQPRSLTDVLTDHPGHLTNNTFQ